jgi:hypothetical protein
MAKVGARMAKQGWHKGWLTQAAWAEPIKAVLQREIDEARALAIRESEEARKAKETERDLIRRESINRRAEMIKIGGALRSTLGAGVASLQRAGAVVVKVMDTLANDLQAGVFDKMGPGAKMKLAKEFIEAEGRLTEAFERLDKIARLEEGRPTEVIQVEDMTVEQAVQEIESAKALLDLAREEGLLDTAAQDEIDRPNGKSNGSAVH